ncbi:MAG: fluoride efflux transporter CrcB [Bacteroidetes bacterium]|nr:fluoride efflux transporter CrcB [Bacteroidota bacterium]
MKNAIVIFIGSGFGGITRYYLAKLINKINLLDFPLGILSVNIFACFLSGLFAGMLTRNGITDENHLMKLLLVVGFCGGFSTFSGFTDQTIRLLQQNNQTYAIVDVFLSIAICLLVTLGGFAVSKHI